MWLLGEGCCSREGREGREERKGREGDERRGVTKLLSGAMSANDVEVKEWEQMDDRTERGLEPADELGDRTARLPEAIRAKV